MIPGVVDVCDEIRVDRVEAAWAVVEWCGRDVGEVPVAAIAGRVQEGDRIVIRVRRGAPSARLRIFSFRNVSGEPQEKDNG